MFRRQRCVGAAVEAFDLDSQDRRSAATLAGACIYGLDHDEVRNTVIGRTGHRRDLRYTVTDRSPRTRHSRTRLTRATHARFETLALVVVIRNAIMHRIELATYRGRRRRQTDARSQPLDPRRAFKPAVNVICHATTRR